MIKQIKITSKSPYLAEALGSVEMFEISASAKLEIIDHDKIVEVGSEKFQKPVILKDLIAAINNAAIPEKIEFKEFTLFPKLRSIQIKEAEVSLTEKEVSILLYLIDSTTNTANKSDMLRDIWGANEQVETKTLETHIYRLRQKLEDHQIKNCINSENDSITLVLTNI
jgi:DNA-binding response OmpR family regulator